MKITTVFLSKFSLLKSMLATILIISLFGNILSECNIKFGCLARQKFMSYVTVQDKSGDALPNRSIMNFKNIYIFTDRIVFYTSTDVGSAVLDPEDSKASIDKIEAKVERVIQYGDIILDCGKFHNKLCHGQEYPGIDKLESFKEVKKTITSNADVYCLVLPFFENGYKKMHEKMAYICGNSAKDLYNIITFKNYISRKIELYQLKMSNDRYNGFNGVMKKKGNFVTKVDGKVLNVIARIYNRGMSLSFNENPEKFIKFYSFYQQRLHTGGAYLVSQGLTKKKVPEEWSAGLNPVPSPDCCMYFKGETENLVLCLAAQDGKSLETAGDMCQSKMKPYHGEVMNSMRGIKFAEAFSELSHNTQKLKDCKSAEYRTMKWRAEKTIDYAIDVDCKYVMNYCTGDDYTQKYTFCYKNYADELKLELKLMSLDDDDIYDGINNCVYKSDQFKKAFTETHFKDLMKNAKLNRPGSFLELSANSNVENDDIDDDDEEVVVQKRSNKRLLRSGNLKNKNVNENSFDEEPVFAETNSLSQTDRSGGKKKKTIRDFVYSKPKDNFAEADLNRIRIFRNTQMNDLQKTHTWEPAPSEGIDEKFNKFAASLGKKNTDEFVSFLGYLRDASYRASKMIAKNEEKKLLNNSK